MNSAEYKFEILKMYFESLRVEILEKIKLSHQLSYYKLLALGVLIGLSSAKEIKAEYEVVVLIAISVLALAFDLALYFNGIAILKVGRYIRDSLEPPFKSLIEKDCSVVLWEEYISPPDKKSTQRQRWWWNLFEAVQPLISIIAQGGCLYLLHGKDKVETIICSIVFLIMLSNMVLLVFTIIRKSKSDKNPADLKGAADG